jgi:hypothetical protein
MAETMAESGPEAEEEEPFFLGVEGAEPTRGRAEATTESATRIA